jgi:hypothetical protein
MYYGSVGQGVDAAITQPQTPQLCANIARSFNGLLELLGAETKSLDGWYSQALTSLRTPRTEFMCPGAPPLAISKLTPTRVMRLRLIMPIK